MRKTGELDVEGVHHQCAAVSVDKVAATLAQQRTQSIEWSKKMIEKVLQLTKGLEAEDIPRYKYILN